MDNSFSWQDYWESETKDGEVFLTSDGKKHDYLSEHWENVFASFPSHSKILDIASGAGSIYTSLPEPERFKLYASDISPTALSKLKSKIKHVSTTTCSSDELLFDDANFDVVVSQFGIEYADKKAFIESVRVLKPGGRFIFILHKHEGLIYTRYSEELAALKLINEGEFIARAIRLTQALGGNSEKEIVTALDDFKQIEPKVAEVCANTNQGLHHHLYNGYRSLMERRSKYEKADIIDWLQASEKDIQIALKKLSDITSVCLSEDELNDITSGLRTNGATDVKFDSFTIPGQSIPIAWCLEGSKTQ